MWYETWWQGLWSDTVTKEKCPSKIPVSLDSNMEVVAYMQSHLIQWILAILLCLHLSFIFIFYWIPWRGTTTRYSGRWWWWCTSEHDEDLKVSHWIPWRRTTSNIGNITRCYWSNLRDWKSLKVQPHNASRFKKCTYCGTKRLQRKKCFLYDFFTFVMVMWNILADARTTADFMWVEFDWTKQCQIFRRTLLWLRESWWGWYTTG